MAIEVRVTHLSGSRRDDVDTFRKLPIRVGRGDDCALQFDPEKDAKVSTTHAEFKEAGDGLVHLDDLGSQNGTYVNGTPVDEGGITVPDRAIVEFGKEGPRVRIEITPGGGINFGRLEEKKVAQGRTPVPTERHKPLDLPPEPEAPNSTRRFDEIRDELAGNNVLLLGVFVAAIVIALIALALLILN